MSSGEIKIFKSVLSTLIPALLLIGLLSRCANIAAPQGGPLDSIPPRIIVMTPPYGTTNFTARRITIEFDEYIKIVDQQKQFFTSPLMGKAPVITPRGKSIRIDLKEDLDSNRTYSLNFGQSVRDNNEGNPFTGLRYVFSTGDYIDSMLMSGYTIDAQKGDSASNVFIYFYENDIDSIKLNPDYDSTLFLFPPQSVARSFPNGIVIAENLRPTDYRIYALEDKNGNMKYEPGVDKVGFMDSVYNPAFMPPFDMWFDTMRNQMAADPQILLRMFTEQVYKRQNLISPPSRPLQNKVIFNFLGPFPQIDTLRFDGIEPSEIITEYLNATRDSIAYWLNVPPERLSDTLTGRLAYQRHDSVGNLYTHGQDLKVVWKAPAKPKEKERDKKNGPGEENAEPNPFKVKVTADNVLIPEKDIIFEFEYPLVQVDSASIVLERIGESMAPATQRPGPGRPLPRTSSTAPAEEKITPVKFHFTQDTMMIRTWRLSADWYPEEKYRLTILPGAFENILREQNDSLKANFTIASPDKFATLILDIVGKTLESKYVLTINSQSGQLIKEVKDVSSGKDTIRFITPGDIRIKILDDMNGNGIWDAGSLVARRQSERVEPFYYDDKGEIIPAKANWELAFTIDMNEVFRPMDMDYIRAKLARAEQEQERKRLEKIKEQEKSKQGAGSSPRSPGRAERSEDYNMQSLGQSPARTGQIR